ncbi:MAG: PCMD domain-containing protein [Bacteroidaceae bacterium]|nr:PCMD domain-containing protein [Bacteroidaceae bacterium]
MTKNNILCIALMTLVLSLSSCIREEALNAECDVLSADAAWFKENNLLNGDVKITNNEIIFIINKEANLNTIPEPEIVFQLTPGARIEKDSTKRNKDGIFQYYTTYSEDGNWNKQYIAKFIKLPPLDEDHVFSFEHFELSSNNKYNIWYEINNNGIRSDLWASGNAGFMFTGKGKTPDDFPTTTDANGKRGNCIRLTTRDTGSFGKMAGMPIAAGNIFVGEFLSENAMKKPLEATRFGMNIAPRKPAYLTGYYKYTPGEVFTDKKKNPVEGRRDTCAIYSVLYEVDPDNFVSLDGSNVTSSDRIVLIAEIKNPGEPDQWTEFMIPFEAMNDKVFDPERLANNGYAIAVVASSSKDGAFFEGAVGSTLHVDELSIIWE